MGLTCRGHVRKSRSLLRLLRSSRIHVLVGDTKAPLLRIVDRPSDIKGIEHRIMNPVQYVPVQKKCFDTVKVSIMLDSGTPVPFLAGKTVVVLEFRRAIHSYFSI